MVKQDNFHAFSTTITEMPKLVFSVVVGSCGIESDQCQPFDSFKNLVSETIHYPLFFPLLLATLLHVAGLKDYLPVHIPKALAYSN